ncbi:hypothetical protein HBA55_20580 [Pseudomaricurvus alkylphenolicus]|uniref:hypothetical protein n=1 Tax=Pseudomaricurvus alkylphenolicus TaxID=1306991 RepID=UPI001422E8D7|nr:hypothetical protein [Pseudomaricurvus alkylphenolicus]NIB42013.1 hypothetical protein [Pseudomaricurvus alkylphenolicus]
MQPKEIMIVVGGALLLTNLSIVGTLFATGYFDSDKTTESKEAAAAQENEIEEPAPGAITPPKKRALHSMAKAMYLCEDKLNAANTGKRMSYEFNAVASRFDTETDSYTIFINTQTASRASAPEESAEVTCEVSAADLSITNYKVMKD